LRKLVVLVEGTSEFYVMEALLKKLGIPPAEFKVIPHQGHGELKRKLHISLRAWRDAETRFLIMRDNDSGDCNARKAELLKIIAREGKLGQSKVRIVCQELEAWFLGDGEALRKAGFFGKDRAAPAVLRRDPDSVAKPSQHVRKMRPDHKKTMAAQKIAPFLDPARNRSESFRNTIKAIKKLAS
jgi:Domain of unknown function (DUF4276)